MDKEKEKNQQLIIMLSVLYVAILFITLHYLQLYNTNTDGLTELELLINCFNHALSHPFSIGKAFSGGMESAKIFGIVTGLYLLFAAYYFTSDLSKRHEDSKTAKGSAHFSKDFKGFAKTYTLEKKSDDPKAPDPNIILSKNLRLGLKKGKNVNVVIIGSAGSGKSFGVIKPNIMQQNSSYVVTDPSGEIFHSMGDMLLKAGYNVKIFSTSNMAFSHCYNPFDYCYDEEGKIDETRVSTMITLFLNNATELQKKGGGGDPFWEKASKALLTACAMYLLEFRPEEEHNMYQILVLVQMGKVDESKSNSETKLDGRFNAARLENPEAHCFSSYDTFKLAPAKTANSILISAAVDLNMFDQDRVRNLTTTDYFVQERSADNLQIRKYLKDANGKPIRTDKNINLKTLGDEKTAIFVMTPQANPTYNFLVTMFYSQLFEVLYGIGENIAPKKWMVVGNGGYPVLTMIDSEEDAKHLIELYKTAEITEVKSGSEKGFYLYNRTAEEKFWIPGINNMGRLKKVYSKEVGEKFLREFKDCKIEHQSNSLPWHVQCLLDEFSNIGEIPEFPQKLATSRKYEISAMVVLQSLAQLKNRYDKLWGDVLSNCDTTIFLGTKDPETCKWVSEVLGKRTIRVRNTSTSHSSKGGNSSDSFNTDARELAQPDEVARLAKNKCYIIATGEFPFIDDKFMALNHPRWEETGDKNPEFAMDPAQLVICTEKKLSRKGDAYAAIAGMQNAMKGRNEKGSPVIREARAKTGSEIKHEAGGSNASTVKNAENKFTYRGKEQDPTNDIWDDMRMDGGFGGEHFGMKNPRHGKYTPKK